MLKRLSVKNFAVIESLDLEFGPGLTVFTGETGAGKSIVIEALGFLLGDRGASDWVRAGAKKLEVSGVFEEGPRRLELRRELDTSGRSKAWVDGAAVKLSDLVKAGEGLADFHGQHEHQTLLQPAVQLDLLDGFGGHEALREEAAAAYRAWRELCERKEALELSEEERLHRIDMIKFQLAEINAVRPKPGEEDRLVADLPRLKNAARLGELAEGAYAALYESEGSAEESLAKAVKAVEEMARYDAEAQALAVSLSAVRAAASDAAEALSRWRGADTDPAALDELIGRQDKLAKLKRKYGATIEDILAFREKAGRELSALENHAAESAAIDKECAAAKKRLDAACAVLHDARHESAGKLSKKVAAHLKDLGMALAKLSVSVEMDEESCGPTGADRVEFLIAANPGEPLRALRQVASGGELSRVMLALKTVLAAQDKVGLMVFDEVDTGVGAAVGASVGKKLAELGSRRQVLCVTHLAQVACQAAHHFKVAKAVAQGRTATSVTALTGERRVEAVAALLGGEKLTPASLRHAKELIESL